MSTFPKFSSLAPELRHMIWDMALENEADNRIVLVHRLTLRVLPSKSLISPIMAVDKESRERALTHYNVKLSISTFPAPSVTRPGPVEKWDHIYSRSRAERLLNDLSDDASKGCIYVNLARDKFLLSFTYSTAKPPGIATDDCVSDLFSYAKVVETLGPGSTRAYKMHQPCVGPKLSPEQCNKITNVVHRRGLHEGYVKPWPGKIYYPSGTASVLWMAQRFTKLSNPTTDAKFLVLESRDYCVLIHKVIHEGAKSLEIEEWQTEDDKRHGWRVWKSMSPPKSA
ncbi:hypothetical protein PG985_014117 [Apiospora marii]|uniref:uncharacterized protein n=1 Tax=Apiospora marii TaxID=335849 RepID=UPI00312D045F